MVDLARSMVFEFADETPGADVITAPRTAGLPVATLGRCVAALAEAMQVRLRESNDVEHLRVTIAQLAHVLSALGQVISADTEPGTGGRGGAGVVPLPQGLLNRAARYLEATAALVTEGVVPEGFDPSQTDELAGTFRSDAGMLRHYASQ